MKSRQPISQGNQREYNTHGIRVTGEVQGRVVEPIVRNGDPPDGLGVWVWDPSENDLAVDWDTPCR